MKVSVVIRCFNEEKHIGRLLTGISQQTLTDPEIVVVDSGSTDATLSIASQFPVRIVSVPPEEFSFGRALNTGLRACTGDVAVLASAHVYPLFRDWLERLTAPFGDGRVALTYGRQRGDARTRFSEHQIMARWFPDHSHPGQDHPFCNNANAAVRRAVWEVLPYDETLTGLEDLDWAVRAMKLGHRLVYAAEAEVVHVHEEVWSAVYNRYRREAIAMKHIFPHESFSAWDALRLWSSNVFADGCRAVGQGVLLKNLLSIPTFRLMQFWGTYRGYAQKGPVSVRLKRRFYYPKGPTRIQAPPLSRPESERIDYTAPHAPPTAAGGSGGGREGG